MRAIGLLVAVAIGIGLGSMLLASNQDGNATAPGQWKYNALPREAIQEKGHDPEDKPPGVQVRELTRGLNRLAVEGWEPILIEPGRTVPITGPGNPTMTHSPVYIFRAPR